MRSKNQPVFQLDEISKKMLWMVIGLVMVFILIQCIKLATVGRLGTKISSIKSEQETITLENELLRAEISDLLSASNLEQILREDDNLVAKDVRIIEPLLENSLAQAN